MNKKLDGKYPERHFMGQGIGIGLAIGAHWSSVKDFELHNLAVFHTSYALHIRDPISRRACCALFDQANLIGLATEIAATSRFLS